VTRCAETNTPLSFCGEDAGRPVEAVVFAALGLQSLSMRPASIGPVKSLIRRTDLAALRAVVDAECEKGSETVRPAVMDFLAKQS
jgi:phosphotransferase system enzyme I (PtsP)